MSLTFRVLETTTARLWEFGWLDVSRFAVDGSTTDRTSGEAVVRAFIADPISGRSFLGWKNPWGADEHHHGPFVRSSLRAEWYRPVAREALGPQVAKFLEAQEWNEPPSAGELHPIQEWIDALATDVEVFMLQAPPPPAARWECWYIWRFFAEFVSVSPERSEMTIAVVGED